MLKRLEKEIEQMRGKMVRTAEMYGMDHLDVYQYSQQLDKLYMKWYRIKYIDRVRENGQTTFTALRRVPRFPTDLRERASVLYAPGQ